MPPAKPELWVINLRVSMDQARRAREVLARCCGVGVLRCHPHPWRHEVDFEVMLPASQHEAVVHAVMTQLPQAEWGRPQHGPSTRHQPVDGHVG